MISSYSDFLTQLGRLIVGEQVSYSSLPIDTLRQIIAIGERNVYRKVRSLHNEKDFDSIVVTGNAANLPTDFIVSSVVHFGKKALEPVSEEWLREYLNSQPDGDIRYFCSAGNSLLFGPAVTDGTLLQGRYFFRYPDLDETTFSSNTLFAQEPNLFIYGCLVEAVPFFPQSGSQAQLWAAQFESAVDRVNTDASRAAASAGRLRRRASIPVMR